MTKPAAASAATPALGFPGEGLIQQWAGIAHVSIGGAVNRAEQMYAGDPAALQNGSEQAQAVADGLDKANQNLQQIGAAAAQAWEGPQGTAFIAAHGASMKQVTQARTSATGLAQSLTQTAHSVQAAKNAVAAASGLTAVALGTLQPTDPKAVQVARGEIENWAGVIARLAQQSSGGNTGPVAAGQGGGGGGGGGAVAAEGASGGAPTAMPSGQVSDWMNQALTAMGITDPYQRDPTKPDSIAHYIAAIINRESSGNPNAINNWDSNAAAGTPSKGIMQTIDSTFSAHALPGHTDIWNPVDNIIAGTRYAMQKPGGLAGAASGSNY